MIITDVKTQKNKRFSIFLDGEYSFSCGYNTLITFGLRKESEITSEIISRILTFEEFENCKTYAMNILSIKPYAKQELIKKFKLREYSFDTIEKTVKFLEEYKYIDDLAYAKLFAESKMNNLKKGKYLIKLELLKKGISKEDIAKVLDEADDGQALTDAIKKKAKQLDLTDYKNIAKLKAFLFGRGFSMDDINFKIAEYIKNSNFEDDIWQ